MEAEVARLCLAPGVDEGHSNDLWVLAIEIFQPQDRNSLNFSYYKLSTLLHLKQEPDEARKKCDERRLPYKRKNEEKFILRDVLRKVVKWINILKEVGDTGQPCQVTRCFFGRPCGLFCRYAPSWFLQDCLLIRLPFLRLP